MEGAWSGVEGGGAELTHLSLSSPVSSSSPLSVVTPVLVVTHVHSWALAVIREPRWLLWLVVVCACCGSWVMVKGTHRRGWWWSRVSLGVVGHSLLSVHGRLWSFVHQRGHSLWGVVGRSSLSVCGWLWLFKRQRGRLSCAQPAGVRWGTPRRGWGVLWALVVVHIHVGVVVVLVMLYLL